MHQGIKEVAYDNDLTPRLPDHPQNQMEPIRISYFSDVLCVWAYIAQIRLDELTTNFQDKISIDYHFAPIFGNAHEKLESRWRDRGGFKGYSDHVQKVVSVSPTLIFNEGRQRLNGNVGYRVIEANIRELLHNPPEEQSWC